MGYYIKFGVKKMNKAIQKSAFTLAEVLITLGIIGVVAAITLPPLLSKYRSTVTVNELKKTYSELQQAIKMSEVYNGDFRYWDWTLDEAKFSKKYIMPYLAKKYTVSRNFDYYTLNGNYTHVSTKAQYYYNGKKIAFKVIITKRENMDDIKYAEIYVDLDGEKRQSIMGKDVFLFTLFNYTYLTGGWVLTPLCPKGEHYGLHLGGIGGYWGAYCATLEGVLGQDSARGDCTPNKAGTNCGLAIEKNGWAIPDKYPIKF